MLVIPSLTYAPYHCAFPALQLAAGSVAFITGPNGSGKTTWLRCIAQLLGHNKATWQGCPLAEVGFGYKGPQLGFDPAGTVGETLAFFQALAERPRWSLADLQKDLHVGPLWHQALERLSKGQQARVSLWAAVMDQHAVWLLDEPTAYLDTVATQEVGDLLRAHVEAGGVALVATHDSALQADVAGTCRTVSVSLY